MFIVAHENIALQRKVLEKLTKQRIIGAKHIQIDNLICGVPSHLRGKLREEIENLVCKDYIRWYNRSNGSLHLNIDKLQEIHEFLEQTRGANP